MVIVRFQGEWLRQGRGVRRERVLHHPPLGGGGGSVPDSVVGRIVVCQVGHLIVNFHRKPFLRKSFHRLEIKGFEFYARSAISLSSTTFHRLEHFLRLLLSFQL